MMGVAEKKWPGSEAEQDFAKYLVANHGAHFVTVVRRGAGRLLGVSIPRQTIVVKELMDAASSSTLESLQRENEELRGVVERAQSIVSTSTYPNWHETARHALASTGGEHHAE